MIILPFGDRAILVEFESLHATMDAFATLSSVRPHGVLELVPAARTVLVRIDPSRLSFRAVEQWVRTALGGAAVPGGLDLRHISAPLVVPVRYDGADLAAAAEILGISSAELVSRHSQAEWRCAFIGFAPGFAYLASEYADFSMSRRDTSRTEVPAGSVGLAGEFTGVYPRRSPGGWQLIGTTDVVLWVESNEAPATITPGMTVRFEVVEP